MQFKTSLPRHLPASEALPGNRLTEFEGIDLSYDAKGNLSEKKLPDGTHLHFGYDALNRKRPVTTLCPSDQEFANL